MTGPTNKILVIGTTPDYIEWIRGSCPGRALFITDPELRLRSDDPSPDPDEEILVPLSDHQRVLKSLQTHLNTHRQTLDGIFCFDCENMELASILAPAFDLDYPSIQAVRNCRDKHASKRIWQARGLGCPQSVPIHTLDEVLTFFRSVPDGCVIKPFTGSGSELVMRCETEADCNRAFHVVQKGLEKRTAHPLFRKSGSASQLMMAEEFVPGTEYSCDFIIETGTVRIIRTARKIKLNDQPFGTVTGYLLPCEPPPFSDGRTLPAILKDAAQSLGIERGFCMVDFIVRDGRTMLIEMTPRPGGDCIPHMMKACVGLDMLRFSLDFAARKTMSFPDASTPCSCLAVRLHAKQAGILKAVQWRSLIEDPRFASIHLIRKPGHRVQLPPQDYDSWLLGHVILTLFPDDSPDDLAADIASRIRVIMADKSPGVSP